ncbi:MAG: hypothetical protein H0W20_03610 [Chthoniobacterales bacterium]|nr:hypothetical protein [Chthoniobacterales bacterium]
MRHRIQNCLLLVAVFSLCSSANALVLDWDAVNWTPGSLNNAYDIAPATPGNDVTVAVTGNTAQFQTAIVGSNPQTPAITNSHDGGLNPAQKTLTLAVNFTSRSEAITIKVDFSALYPLGVQNVSFVIFDVDFSNNSDNNSTVRDQLRSISALSIDGITQIAPTITVSANNSLSGSGLAQVVNGTRSTVDTGTGSGAANVTINFGSGSGTVSNPTYQHIGLHDISFKPVPEINPMLASMFACLAGGVLAWLRGRKTDGSRPL